MRYPSIAAAPVLFLIALLVLSLSMACASRSPGRGGVSITDPVSVPSSALAHDLMHVLVQPDRVMIGKEFVPRRLDLPQVKVVAAGETFEPAADSSFDYIEIAGTLKVSRARSTSLKFQHLFVLPGGTLDAGTTADPIPAGVKVEFVVLSVPIDTAKDPFQWGNGLLNFGHRFVYGAKKLEWTSLTAEVRKGGTTLELAEDPLGWAVGDELLVPESDQPAANSAPRREAPAMVAAIAGRTVTLSKALDFDHLAQRDPDGNVVLLPRVANLTRNVVVRSEDPNGTPGHVADVGHGAMWDVRYAEQNGLGRTRAEHIDSTTADPVHIGTNQVGRYNEHHHHAMGLGSASIGNVYRGGGPKTGKWGIALHGTHDARLERNIAIDFRGAGFVTEDGYEVRNVFRQNFGAYNVNPAMLTTTPDVALHNVQDLNAPGIEGACAWFRGIMNTFDRNECWANGTGINLFNITAVAGAYPSAPGKPNDVTFTPNPDSSKALPVLVAGNVMASNVKFGLESWGLNKFPHTNAIASYNAEFQFNYVISNPTKVYLVNPMMVGKAGTSKCISVSSSYTETLDIDGGRIVGCNVGVVDGGAIQSVKITRTAFQNVLDIDAQSPPVVLVLDNVLHKPMPGKVSQYIQFGRDVVWPGPPKPLDGPPSALNYYYQRGGRIRVIKNDQGVTGKDYRLIHPQQLSSALAWPAGFGLHQYGSPEAGLTMGQTWAKYGQAWGGEAVDRAKLVKLDGVIAPGLVVEGGAIPLGPPRAILTYPNAGSPAVISHDGSGSAYIELNGLVTGDPAAASEAFMFSVDDGPAQSMQSGPDWVGDQRKYGLRTGLDTGPHRVKTWRTTTAGAKIGASEMTFSYSVDLRK